MRNKFTSLIFGAVQAGFASSDIITEGDLVSPDTDDPIMKWKRKHWGEMDD